MMTLQGWRQVYSEADKSLFMESKLWKSSFSTEWVWELAVVDATAISRLYAEMNECEQCVLEMMLNGILLHAKQEDELLSIMSHQLRRPRQHILSALLEFAKAGLVIVVKHPWQGSYWIMPVPIFHSFRASLRHPLDFRSNVSIELPIALRSATSYANPLMLGIRLLLFLHALSGQTLTFTKRGELNKATIKSLQKHQQRFTEEATLSTLLEGWQRLFPEARGGIEGFLIELALDLGVLERSNQGLEWNSKKFEGWLRLTQHDQDEILWQWLLQQLSPVIPHDFAVFLHDVMLASGNWVMYDRYDHGVGDTERNLLRFFSACGLLSFVLDKVVQKGMQDPKYRIFTKREFAPASYETLHLEDNGMLLALPGTRPRLVWEGLDVAELMTAQETLMLRMTPSSIGWAVTRGHSLATLSEWLGELVNGELPILIQGLLRTLSGKDPGKDSDNENGHLEKPAISLNTINESSRQTLHMQTEESTKGRRENTEFYELRELGQWGYYCRNPLVIMSEAELLSVPQLKQQAWLLESAIESIPRSWHIELRRYHSSTIVQIVDMAIQVGYGLYVKIRGKHIHLLPQILEERNEQSILTAMIFAKPARLPVVIELSDIEAIQLDINKEKAHKAIGILPGV